MVHTRTRRRALIAAALRGGAATLLGSLAARPAQAATILAVRVWPAQDYTRVAFELDEALKFVWQSVPDPDRVVVDLDGIALDGAIRELVAKVQPDDPYIRRVRVGQFRPGVARIVLDLKAPVSPQVFPLAPVAAYRHRLVIDLRPLVPPDPLAQLIERQTRARPAASGEPAAADEPLGAGAGAGSSRPDSRGDADALGAIAREAESRDRDRARAAAAAERRRLLAGTVPSEGALVLRPPSVADPAPADPMQAVEGPRLAQVRTEPWRRPARAPAVTRLVTVAIDPGHGGEDPGAVGARGTQEKDVVLRVARRLRERIDAEPGMRAFLTRDADFFVPLAERVRKARAVQADLFVSIHADAFVDPDARGASVFVLSERGASSTAARWLARRENASDQVGGVSLAARNREVARLLLDLSTRAQIEHSMRLGRAVLDNLSGLGRLHKAQVEQAGFAVLKAPDIPSILVETAFISNPQEEARLSDDAYQARLAQAIFGGIRNYFRRWPPVPRARETT